MFKDDDDVVVDERLADNMKADSKIGSAGSDPQSKWVKDVLSRQAEQEAAKADNTVSLYDVLDAHNGFYDSCIVDRRRFKIRSGRSTSRKWNTDQETSSERFGPYAPTEV
jgi:hypothetical protein